MNALFVYDFGKRRKTPCWDCDERGHCTMNCGPPIGQEEPMGMFSRDEQDEPEPESMGEVLSKRDAKMGGFPVGPLKGGYTAPGGDGQSPPLPTTGSGVMGGGPELMKALSLGEVACLTMTLFDPIQANHKQWEDAAASIRRERERLRLDFK